MAEVSKYARMLKVATDRPNSAVEAVHGIEEITLSAEVLRKASAAAEAAGQTTSEWICEAVAEVLARRSRPS